LLAGKFWGAGWLDPVMGMVGAALVARWSFGLIRDSSRVLLDYQPNAKMIAALQASIEDGSTDRVTDLHVWSIGHGIYAAELVVVSHEPKSAGHYKSLIASTEFNVVHSTIEVHPCESS